MVSVSPEIENVLIPAFRSQSLSIVESKFILNKSTFILQLKSSDICFGSSHWLSSKVNVPVKFSLKVTMIFSVQLSRLVVVYKPKILEHGGPLTEYLPKIQVNYEIRYHLHKKWRK